MSEISTEELAQWLEKAADKWNTGQQAMNVWSDPVGTLRQAAARLRALAEDAERLDWLESKADNFPHVIVDYFDWSVTLWDDETHERTFPVNEPTIRQAIDKARHD